MATLNGEKSNQVSGESGIPEKPPDGEGGEVVQKLSYKDRVLGKVSVLKEPTSLLHEGKDINGRPWMMFNYYLMVHPWTPKFVVTEATIDKTLVWIRFPSLWMVYYDETVLLTLASTIATPIKVDLNILNMHRGKFVRGLHILWGNCGCCGNATRNCTKSEPKVAYEV
ncbi:hypothetical protein JHK86_053018 [Glycine max]|nr:hypothetical protein JHK86_053018 [Glycine max]